MDQISGFLPQIGWSPLQMPATPKKPPASTVEPAAKSANTKGGLGAQVDTQTPQDHAQTARLLETIAAASAYELETDGTAQTDAPIDPDGPTGPPPTFDVTPLEAEAVRRMSVPKTVAEVQDKSDTEAARTVLASDDPAPARQGAAAEPDRKNGETRRPDRAKQTSASEQVPVSTSQSGSVWKSIGAPEPHQMDLTR